MGFFEKNRNLLFWGVQIISWGTILGVGYLFTPDIKGFKDSPQFHFSLWASFFIGLFTTGLHRFYLKRKIDINEFSSKEVVKILIAILITSLLYAGLSRLTGICSDFFFEKKNYELPEMYKKFGWELLVINSFITVFVWTIFYLAFKVFMKYNKDRVERAELNAHLRQAQLNTLKGQINPHFMFNSLNNIRGLMLEDVEKSREMLTKLSEMLRYSLTKNNQNGIAVSEELEMVDNYVSLAKIQLEDRLTFTTDVCEDCLHESIPPMVIQLLVENAVKHGISNLKNGGVIDLKLFKSEGLLHIEVGNTGTLQFSKNSTHLGLENIKQRLRLLYGDKASFQLQEEGDQVMARIKIPMS
jgi:signal transduction histidine kinase